MDGFPGIKRVALERSVTQQYRGFWLLGFTSSTQPTPKFIKVRKNKGFGFLYSESDTRGLAWVTTKIPVTELEHLRQS